LLSCIAANLPGSRTWRRRLHRVRPRKPRTMDISNMAIALANLRFQPAPGTEAATIKKCNDRSSLIAFLGSVVFACLSHDRFFASSK
jgi:hypothetical protein